MTCRKCNGSDCVRSHRRWYERALSLLRIRPYRCRDCNYRGLHFANRKDNRAQSPFGLDAVDPPI